MSDGAPATLTLHELQAALAAGQVTPRELVESLLARIERINPSVHAYITLDPDAVRRQLEEQLARVPAGRLRGIPITIKDNLCLAGEETTCGSRILRNFRPPYDATVIERLKQAGALLIPRANMDEFAFGSSTETSVFGPTKNPWALDRVPGGSSGGSAAAVAADCAIAALGTDTGGSIRQPAAFCGVVGLKPTYGRVSRYGLIAFASSLDQIGPITKDITDAAIILSVIAGHDPRDSTSAPVDVPDYVAGLQAPVTGLRVGIPQEFFVEGMDTAVEEALRGAIKGFEHLGLRCESVSLPHTPTAVATYYIIATAEASSNLARYDGVQYGFRAPLGSGFRAQGSEDCSGLVARGSGQLPRAHSPEPTAHFQQSPEPPAQNELIEMYLRTRTEGFGTEVKRRILLGTYVLSHGYYEAYYLKGLKVRTLIKQDFDRAFERCDVILTPTSPTPAFRLGEKLEDPLQMYLSDIFTISVNLAGLPGLSMPCGFTPEGLPIGMQLLAPPFREDLLLRVAYAYEQATEWHKRKPAHSTQHTAH